MGLLARTVRSAPKSLRTSESSASSTTQCDSSVDTMPTCRCTSRREMAVMRGWHAPQCCAPDPYCCTYCSSKAWHAAWRDSERYRPRSSATRPCGGTTRTKRVCLSYPRFIPPQRSAVAGFFNTRFPPASPPSSVSAQRATAGSPNRRVLPAPPDAGDAPPPVAAGNSQKSRTHAHPTVPTSDKPI